MGVSSGAVGNRTEETCFVASKSSRCHKAFPRKKDALMIPCVVVEIPVCESTNDLREINNGSPLTAYGCCFCPDNDCLLATVSVMKEQILSVHDLRHNFFNHSLPTGGFVAVFNITEAADDNGSSDGIENECEHDYFYEESSPVFFTYSPKPCCTFSGNGDMLTVILNSGKESLMIADRECDDIETINDTSDIWFSEINLMCHGQGSTTLCGKTLCAVCDGNRMITVSKVSLSSYTETDVNEVCLWEVKSKTKLKSIWKTSSQVICNDFHGLVNKCKFCPNSSIFGLSSNSGDLLFLYTQTGSLFASINHTENKDAKRSPCDFDFDPSQERVIATVWQNGCLCISKLHEDSVEQVFYSESPFNQPFSNSVKYSPDGDLLAVGTLSGHVLLLDPVYGSCNLVLDISQELMLPDIQNGEDLAVFDISFAKSCQELAVAYNDGLVRIWQLPRMLNLQHICRLEVLKSTPCCSLDRLLIPENLKAYLAFRRIFR